MMTFGDAVEMAKAGRAIRRQCWKKDRVAVVLYTKTMQPYLAVGERGFAIELPYTASSEDIFATDWKKERE